VTNIDFVHLAGFSPGDPGGDAPVVFLDVMDDRSQVRAGEIVWTAATHQPIFTASSSGLQYALVSHWRQTGVIEPDPPLMAPALPVARLLVLSGSCSPLTADQIAHAESHGFAAIRIDVATAVTPETADAELARIVQSVETAFETARGVIVYAARTVDDPAYEVLKGTAARLGMAFPIAQDALGRFMGELAFVAVPRFALTRLVAAGGDTSGRIVESLPIEALEVAYPLAKGAPLCRCHAQDEAYNGLEIALKGGQMGEVDFFVRALGDGDGQGTALSVGAGRETMA
jgi:uncharacterized protein YgbK (DUF1537 family)